MVRKVWIVAVGCALMLAQAEESSGPIIVPYTEEAPQQTAQSSSGQNSGADPYAQDSGEVVYDAVEAGGERVVPHRVERKGGSGGYGSDPVVDTTPPVEVYGSAGTADRMSGTRRAGARKARRNVGGKNPIFQRYLRLIKKRLHLTESQRGRIRRIVQKRKQIWRVQQKKFRRLQKKYSRVPEARLFMSKNRFSKNDFKMAVVAREAELKYLKEEKHHRYINWMAETMKEIFAVLTPQQRKDLIRLTSHRKRDPRNIRRAHRPR